MEGLQRRYQFGEFEVSADGLWRAGVPVAIEPTPFAVLLYLIEHQAEVVSHAELKRAVWSDTHVTTGSQHRAMRALRRTLGDDAEAPTFIKTVGRRGYQFVAHAAEVVTVDPALASVVTAVLSVIQTSGPGRVSNGLDRSVFVRDVTIPDGSTVWVNQRFTKQWELRNDGGVPWVNRYLARQGPCTGKGRLQSADRVPLPTTQPGQHCIASVDLQAPSAPGSCQASWKMVEADGRFCFPCPTSVYISVDVIAPPRDSRAPEDLAIY